MTEAAFAAIGLFIGYVLGVAVQRFVAQPRPGFIFTAGYTDPGDVDYSFLADDKELRWPASRTIGGEPPDKDPVRP